MTSDFTSGSVSLTGSETLTLGTGFSSPSDFSTGLNVINPDSLHVLILPATASAAITSPATFTIGNVVVTGIPGTYDITFSAVQKADETGFAVLVSSIVGQFEVQQTCADVTASWPPPRT